VNKLRAILLYEADFNFNNNVLGRQAMYYGEEIRATVQEHFRSCKEHTAIDQGLNIRLTFDQLQLKHSPGALCSNDAKACYDRIVHAIASICLQRLGTPSKPIVCMFITVQKLRHHICTIYGDSTLSFGGDLWLTPIQGVGQGNSAGHQIWAAVSTPILNLLHEEGCGAFFKMALSGDELHFVGYAFVNGTDLCSAPKNKTATYKVALHSLQEGLNLW
jgi:hypothetical protein